MATIAIQAKQLPIPYLRSPNGYDVFRQSTPIDPSTDLSRIESINTIPNYWGHHDEGPTKTTTTPYAVIVEWDPGERDSKRSRTIREATALGMSH